MKLCKTALCLAAAGGVRADEFDEAAAAAVEYVPPSTEGADLTLVETFSTDPLTNGWALSTNERYEGQSWKHQADFREPSGLDGDKAMVMDVKQKYYGLSTVLSAPVSLAGGKEGLVVQYELRLHEGITCSGAYLKLLAADEGFTPEALEESSPFSIMFGPDKCGATDKVHLIFRQKNPVTGESEEKHLTKKMVVKNDKNSHLYTLEVLPDSTFRILVDLEEKASGSLLSADDFSPSFNEPEEIDDPEDKKPSDWVDAAKMKDPEASKPEDWDEDAPRTIPDESKDMPDGWEEDEPEMVADPSAEMPDDWDEEDDGEWEAAIVKNPKCSVGCGEWVRPTIANPEYKGKWSAPMIDNPDYVGVWAPRRISNPAFFTDATPALSLQPIGAVAIEVLANDRGFSFDNIVVGNDLAAAKAFAEATFVVKAAAETGKAAQVKKDEARAKREKALEEGGLSGAVEYYVGEAGVLVSDNLLPVVAGATALFVALMWFCLSGGDGALDGGEEDGAAHKKDDDEEGEEDDEEEEEEDDEEDSDGEEEKKSSLKQRRKKTTD